MINSPKTVAVDLILIVVVRSSIVEGPSYLLLYSGVNVDVQGELDEMVGPLLIDESVAFDVSTGAT